MTAINKVARGEVYIANLGKPRRYSSEQAGIRPVVIVQNDNGNTASPTTIVLPLTTSNSHDYLPVHMNIEMDDYFYKCVNTLKAQKSCVMAEQFKTIDKSKLIRKAGKLSNETMKQLDDVMCLSLGITR